MGRLCSSYIHCKQSVVGGCGCLVRELRYLRALLPRIGDDGPHCECQLLTARTKCTLAMYVDSATMVECMCLRLCCCTSCGDQHDLHRNRVACCCVSGNIRVVIKGRWQVEVHTLVRAIATVCLAWTHANVLVCRTYASKCWQQESIEQLLRTGWSLY